MHRGRVFDLLIRGITITTGALFIPWVSLVALNFFGLHLNWFPIGGAIPPVLNPGQSQAPDVVQHLILPVVVLTFTSLGPYVLFLRTSMVEVMETDYVRTARAKGVIERRVLPSHAFRNALIPLVTVIGLRLGFLVGGAVLAETVFAYPGVGRLIFRSVQQHDYPVLQRAFLMLAVTVVLFNLLTDLLYGFSTQGSHMADSSKASTSRSQGRTNDGLSRPTRRYTGWRLIISLYRRDTLGMIGFLVWITLAVLGIIVPLISPYPGAYGSASYVNLPPMSYFLFGTDELGRSIFDKRRWGIRSSFFVAALATIISTGLGVVIGLFSGYFRGKLGDLFTSLIDIFLTLPVLPLMILLASVIPPSRTTVALVIGLFSWPGTARIVRGEAIRLRESDFVDAAGAIGCRHPRILFRHILPNAAPPIFINLSFVAGSAILAEAGLSFWAWEIPPIGPGERSCHMRSQAGAFSSHGGMPHFQACSSH